jgi:hypothetical protein
MSDQEEKPIDDLKPDSAEGEEAQTPTDENTVQSAATVDAPALADERVEDPVDDSGVRFEEAQRVADEAVLAESRRHTRRAFVLGAAGAAAGYGAYQWIGSSPRDEMQPTPFRRAFEANAAIARGLIGDRALAPTYALKEARDLRVNGVYGLKRMLAAESWRLQLVGARGGGDASTVCPRRNRVGVSL